MIVRAFGVAIALSTMFSQPASAVEPIGGWRIEPSDVRCVAVRQYGAVDKPITLALKAPPSEDTLQLAVLRPGFRKSAVQGGATLKLDGESFSANALSYPVGKDGHHVTHLVNLESAQAAALRKAKILEVSVKEGVNEEFPLGMMTSTWDALDKCVEKLRETWHIGVEFEVHAASGPKGDLQALLSAEDYPLSAQREDQQGTASFIVLIDEEGKPRDCTMLHTSGAAILDSRSCGIIMQRARFSPAVDSSGKPIKSFHAQRITWRLEG